MLSAQCDRVLFPQVIGDIGVGVQAAKVPKKKAMNARLVHRTPKHGIGLADINATAMYALTSITVQVRGTNFQNLSRR